MNVKAEAFQNYLNEKKIEAFQSENVPDKHNASVSTPLREYPKSAQQARATFASYINPLHSKLIPEQLPETPLHHWKPNISPHPRFLL